MASASFFPSKQVLDTLAPHTIRDLARSLIPLYKLVFWWPTYRFFLRRFYPLTFLFVFLLRYIRVITSLYGTYKYQPTPIPLEPTYHITDVTVIITTTYLMSKTLHHVVRSILNHQKIPRLVIATAGIEAAEQFHAFRTLFPDRRVTVSHRVKASRREQTAQALKQVSTRLVILQDDHAYWPASPRFVASIIAPFEDPKTGAVSADLQAKHHNHPFSFRGFWNFMGMAYLARRSYEYRGTYGIDRGLSTLPGRFGVFRTEIYASPEFLEGYLDSRLPFKREPLNSDDDKFHTRWLIEHDWDVGLQAGPESLMTTELGEWPKFMGQVLRWTRTTWRNNPGQLMNRPTWVRQPFMSYSLLMWFFRQSLVQELSMYFSLHRTLQQMGKSSYFPACLVALTTWIVTFKFVKVSAHFRKYPWDIVYFPAYLLFGHFHSLIKMYALVTCMNASWATAETVNARLGEVVLERVDSDEDEEGATTRTATETTPDAPSKTVSVGKPLSGRVIRKRPGLIARRSCFRKSQRQIQFSQRANL
ncbi:hypothetical protein ACET3X_008812 [Alternaria dauci]|uniref:Glycosyltransferase family 2 protein n=1 Tax=Alternaria dauci TaxID=48095 RepID=A0ABR3U8K0_9PLEO